MKLVNDDGLEYEADYDPNVLAFVFEDMEIRNPFLSECGRFSVDPGYYGFKAVGTGGGCEALVKGLENGHYLMLSDEDGINIPDSKDISEALIGRYNEKGEMIAICAMKDVHMDTETPAKNKSKKHALSDGPEF